MILEKVREFFYWAYPRHCILCKQLGFSDKVDLCGTCKYLLPWRIGGCEGCGEMLYLEKDLIYCLDCRDQENMKYPYINRVCSLFYYQQPVTKLIQLLKFCNGVQVAPIFTYLLYEQIIHRWYYKEALPEVIVPVPLHEQRLKVRGYNQTELIVRPLEKILDISVDVNLCKRTVNTKPQAQLSKYARGRNIKQAFKVSKGNTVESAVIFDDVITTGNTIKAISKALYEAGVTDITVWAIAHA